jgi:hypothetical protein
MELAAGRASELGSARPSVVQEDLRKLAMELAVERDTTARKVCMARQVRLKSTARLSSGVQG